MRWNIRVKPFFVVYAVLAVLMVVASVGMSSAVSKADYVQHVETKADITSAYTIYRVCNPTGENMVLSSDSDFSVAFQEDKNRLTSWDVKIEEVESYTEDVPIYEFINITVNETQYDNVTRENLTVQSTQVKQVQKGVNKVSKTRKVWRKFQPKGRALDANSCYLIRVEGTYPARLGGTKIDNVLSFAGYTFDEYAWWNQTWDFRQQINITNNAGSTLEAGYSINISFDHATLVSTGKSLANGSDIRIVYTNGSDFSLDWINTTAFNNAGQNTSIRFKLQADIPAGEYNDSYYFYYGNPNAPSPPNNANSVYLVYDDFDRADSGTVGNGWTESEHGSMPMSISNNRLRFQITGSGSSWWDSKVYKSIDYGNSGYKITYDVEFDGTSTGSGVSHFQLGVANYSTGNVVNIYHRYYDDIGNEWGHRFWVSGSYGQGTGRTTSYSGNATLIRYLPNSYEWYENDVLRRSASDSATYDAWVFKVLCYSGYNCFDNVYIDNFMGRKYLSPEPTATLLGEELQDSTPAGGNGTYNKSFTVPSNVSKLKAGVYWYGLTTGASCNISLFDGSTEITEYSVPTFVKEFESIDITLPLIDYTITLTSGYREMTVTNPAPGAWELRVQHDNVTRIDTEISWS